ncbi:hypothetical protein LXA30_17625, partial [Erwinia amylovora]|nr:hypothetical protein [Erwinia amylovora]
VSELVLFSPSVLFFAVDYLFGGDVLFRTIVVGREFPNSVLRVIRSMLMLSVEGYRDGFKHFLRLDFEFVRCYFLV